MTPEIFERNLLQSPPRTQAWTARLVIENEEWLAVRQGVVQPIVAGENAGAMITVYDAGGMGYTATSDLSPAGLKRASEDALEWARRSAGRLCWDPAQLAPLEARGEFRSTAAKPWASLPLSGKLEMLQDHCARLKVGERIVDHEASLWHTDAETLILGSRGGRIHQHFQFLVPELRAVANREGETQTRTFSGGRVARQGGLEVLDELGFHVAAPRIGSEALELLDAPDCPAGRMDLLLAADQMILQIHESIGHPLELDRILGDERNYAGTSFVTLDMFGSYRYGSKLLNIVFDPGVPGQVASYGWDDDGTPARREYVIRDGLLLRPLGSAVSQARAGLQGVANARSSGWNRPPIDRMANLNLEPGNSRFEDMVAAVERGIYMESNNSWSIDDSRNKFQFGCERGVLIEDGRLTRTVKNPNYRGISATFWRSLAAVGDRSTLKVLGTPFCGKGEPNQIMRVGHATPAALFNGVEVFGGAA